MLTRKLAALCEGRRKAVNTRTGLGQQIKAQLKASFPFALELLEGDCQSLLAADFLSKWPDLASLQRTAPQPSGVFSMLGTLAAWTVSSFYWQSSKPPSR